MSPEEIRLRCLECAVRLAGHRLAFYPQEADRSALNQVVEMWAEAWEVYVTSGVFHPQSPEMIAAANRLLPREYFHE